MKKNKIKGKYLDLKSPGSFTALSGFLSSNRFSDREEVERTLNELDTYTYHRPAKTKFKRRYVISIFPNEIHAIDLADMSNLVKENDGMKWMLVITDIFSKMIWIHPLRNKTATEVTKAFRKQLSIKDRRPASYWSDAGLEFKNSQMSALLNKYKINLYQTKSKLKSVYAENVIRIVRTKLQRYFTFKNSNRWVDIIDQLVQSLNSTYQPKLGTSPDKIKDDISSSKAWHNQFKHIIKKVIKEPKLKVGQKVRLLKERFTWTKSFIRKWTTEVFIIKAVRKTRPVPTYYLQDLNGEDILGGFYEQELGPVV